MLMELIAITGPEPWTKLLFAKTKLATFVCAILVVQNIWKDLYRLSNAIERLGAPISYCLLLPRTCAFIAELI